MNILLTSVGRRSYIVDYFREALGGNGRVVATNSGQTYAMSRADAAFISPLIYDQHYLPFLMDVCQREKIDAVMSLFDIDLPVLAKHRDVLAGIGTHFIGPNYETALLCNDKFRTETFLHVGGIKTPRSCLNIAQALEWVAAGEIAFPLLIKPRWGMGSIAVFIARDAEELQVLYGKCRYEIEHSYLAYESMPQIDEAVIIQQFLPGQEYGLDIYKDLSGGFAGAIAKKKIAMRAGETDVGQVVDAMPFESLICCVVEGLDFSGVLSVDCFLADSQLYGVEINPRISGHYPFSHLAGVRYPEQLIHWLNGGATQPELLTAIIGAKGCKDLLPVLM